MFYIPMMVTLFHGRIFRNKAPKRVAFFVWTVALGKILTINNLRKKSIVVMDWCGMCRSEEMIDHLFCIVR